MKTGCQLLAGLVLALSCVAAGPSPASAPPAGGKGNPPLAAPVPSRVPAKGPDYKIGEGDLLTVTVWDLMGEGVGAVSNDFRVGQSGTIKPQLLGQIKAQGLTGEELAAAISKSYEVDAHMIKSARVEVAVIESAAADPNKAQREVEDFILPEMNFESEMPLEHLLTAIHDRAPGFNSIVTREPGVSSEKPIIPPMHLKDITVGQLINFIETNYNSVSVMPINGTGKSAMLFSFHIIGPIEEPAPRKTQVYISRLTDVVNSLGGTQKNLDDVLSLVKAALDANGDTSAYTMKLHAETQTLIFSGDVEQIRVVAEALSALKQVNANSLSGTHQSGPATRPRE